MQVDHPHHPLVGKKVAKPGLAFRMEGDGSFPAEYDEIFFEGCVVRYDPPKDGDDEDVYNFLIEWYPYFENHGGVRTEVFPSDEETMTEQEVSLYRYLQDASVRAPSTPMRLD